jgi:dipeptidyl aminopeptidase/acylaminoacyl peptidase
MYGSTEELFFANWENDGPYWKTPKPKAYTEFSPHNFAQNWNTPILIIQGAQDFRIPETQAMEAFQAAQLLGVPSKFLLFGNENHWILKPQNSLIWQAEFYGWLDKWLK